MQIPVFTGLACLAAHTQAGRAGFRQRDVKFFSDLLSNWVHVGGIGTVYPLHNTQVLRYLSELVTDGQAKLARRGSPPSYRLTRAGMFALLAQATQGSYLTKPREGLLVWYFLKSYSSQIRRMISAVGSDFSRAHALELEILLDLQSFLTRQISFADQEIARLQERIAATEAIFREVGAMRKRSEPRENWIRLVSQKYPYELNAQRSFSELLHALPADIVEWELTTGSALKAKGIFIPMLREIESYRSSLAELLQGERVALV